MTPEEVVARYFDLIRSGRYLEATALVSERYLEEVREEALASGGVEFPSMEEMLEADPELTPEVAEYFLERGPRLGAPSISDRYAGVDTEDELSKLSNREVLARSLECRDPEVQARRHFDRLIERHPRHRARILEQRDGRVWAPRFHVAGSVVDGRWAYVLVVDEIDESSPHFIVPEPGVATLERVGDEWRLAVDPSHLVGFGHHTIVTSVEGEDGEGIYLDPDEPA